METPRFSWARPEGGIRLLYYYTIVKAQFYMRVDEGEEKCSSILAIKRKACTVVGRGDDLSYVLGGKSRKKRCEDNRRDEQNRQKVSPAGGYLQTQAWLGGLWLGWDQGVKREHRVEVCKLMLAFPGLQLGIVVAMAVVVVVVVVIVAVLVEMWWQWWWWPRRWWRR